MRRLAAVLGAYAALAACATPAVQTRVICLPLAPYTPAQQAAMAEALTLLAPASPIITAMGDYGAMRDADRACLAANPKP